jgi:medium-chain acyl-[acyl-carrier-protein] hydrolase
MFARWGHRLADHIDVCGVQLPGRETRLREVAITRMPQMARQLAQELTPWLDAPFAIFGHSLGCLVGFELARELRRRGLPQPCGHFVSGCKPPDIPNRVEWIRGLPDDEFVAQIAVRYGGIPTAVAADPELLRHYLPALRADFEVLGSYQYLPEVPFDCPFWAYNGLADTRVTAGDMEGWRAFTTGRFTDRRFPGGHFYLQEDRSPVLRCLASDLAF